MICRLPRLSDEQKTPRRRPAHITTWRRKLFPSVMVEPDKRQKASFSEGNECKSPLSERADESAVREEGIERRREGGRYERTV